MFALLVLESIVKNCGLLSYLFYKFLLNNNFLKKCNFFIAGSGVHDEVALVSNCESYRTLIKTTEHENVRKKMLELMQTWAFAFRSISKYRAVQV